MNKQTYCYYIGCKNEQCEHHVANLKKPYGDNTFEFFKECEHWDLPEIYFEPSAAKEGNVT